MPHEQVWIENQSFQDFGCSECNWLFKASGTLVGQSADEKKQEYQAQRANGFSAHVCAKHHAPNTE
jgi:hypothetical protein